MCVVECAVVDVAAPPTSFRYGESSDYTRLSCTNAILQDQNTHDNEVKTRLKVSEIALLSCGYLLVSILYHIIGAVKRYANGAQIHTVKLYILFSFLSSRLPGHWFRETLSHSLAVARCFTRLSIVS